MIFHIIVSHLLHRLLSIGRLIRGMHVLIVCKQAKRHISTAIPLRARTWTADDYNIPFLSKCKAAHSMHVERIDFLSEFFRRIMTLTPRFAVPHPANIPRTTPHHEHTPVPLTSCSSAASTTHARDNVHRTLFLSPTSPPIQETTKLKIPWHNPRSYGTTNQPQNGMKLYPSEMADWVL